MPKNFVSNPFSEWPDLWFQAYSITRSQEQLFLENGWKIISLVIYFWQEVLTLRDPETKSRWIDVCAEVAICDDPERLAKLATEIMAILRAEQQRLEKAKIRMAV